jgi:hypothetical protein
VIRRPRGKAAVQTGVLLGLAVSAAGCSWTGYSVTRGIRAITGGPTRTHTIVPVTSSLRRYRIIEAHPLEDEIGGRMPADDERYLNQVLADELGHVSSNPKVVRPVPAGAGAAPPSVPAAPTLVVEGSIDDYDPGYAGLRLIELGFNHMVVTARIRLRDKATGRVMGAASVTAQDDRVTATVRGTIWRLVEHIKSFVGAGYAK